MCCTSAYAGKISVSKDVNITGVVTGSYVYVKNAGAVADADGNGVVDADKTNDRIEASDVSIGIDSGDTKVGEIGYIAVFGTRNAHGVFDSTAANTLGWGDNVVLDFGYVTYKPVDKVTFDIGWILPTAGGEASPSWLNGNFYRGFLWNSEPAAFRGMRLSYEVSDALGVSVEFNHDGTQSTKTNGGNFAVAASGSAGPVDYGVTYFDGYKGRNMIDVLVNSSFGNIDVGVNVDYFLIDDEGKSAGQKDDSAYGAALFVTPKMGMFEIPVRLEYVSDGDTGVYSYFGTATKTGQSVTVTPTLKVGKNAFVRAEVAFTKTDGKTFLENDGTATDSQMSFATQIGYTF